MRSTLLSSSQRVFAACVLLLVLAGPAAADQDDALGRGLRLPVPAQLPEQVALPLEIEGQPTRLVLTRRSLRADGFKLEVSGAEGTRLAEPPPARTYFGYAEGFAGSQVAATLGESGWTARIDLGATPNGPAPLAWRLVPKARGWHELSAVSQDREAVCGVGLVELPEPPARALGRSGSGSQGGARWPLPPPSGGHVWHGPPGWPTWSVREAQIAFDADYPYYVRNGSDVGATLAGVEQQLAENELTYGRDALAVYELTHVVVRTAPYYASTDPNSFLTEFRNDWNANHQGVERDTVVLLTKYVGSGIAGLAYVGTMGDKWWGYAGLFWNDGHDPGIVAHEIGHNWGAGHIDCWPWGGSAMCGSWLLLGPDTSDIVQNKARSLGLPIVAPYGIAARPYADPDVASTRSDGTVRIDVLANDHDVNHDPISIASFDPVSALGGTIQRSTGTGPAGRDELLYSPPTALAGDFTDTFWYESQDPGGLVHDTPVTVSVAEARLELRWSLDETSGAVAADATGRGGDGTVQAFPHFEELADPVALGRSNTSLPLSNAFDGRLNSEFASAGQGPVTISFSTDPGHGTWAEFDFGATVTIDGFRHLDRDAAADWTARSMLIFSADAVFDANDPAVEVVHNRYGSFADYGFGAQSARYVRWEITKAYEGVPNSGNLGATEIAFLRATSLVVLPAPAVTLHSDVQPGDEPEGLFDGDYDTRFQSDSTGVVTQNFSRDPRHGTWAEFDFGVVQDFDGWTHYDFNFDARRVGTSKLIFSADNVFDASDPAVTISHGATPFTEASFATQSARYVRWEVRSKWQSGSSWRAFGGREMSFLTASSGTLVHQWVPGRYGNALELRGDSSLEVSDLPSAPIDAGDAWTLNVFVHLTTPLADDTLLAGFGDLFTGAGGWRYLGQRDGAISLFGAYDAIDSSAPLDLNRWQMLTATFDGRSVVLYKDGVEIARGRTSFANATPSAALGPVLTPFGRKGLSASLDEFSLFGYAMTAAEVADLLVGGTATIPSPANGAKSVPPGVTLAWLPGHGSVSHDVYLGTDAAAVRTATPGSPEFLGNVALPSFSPQGLVADTTYFWRVDQVRAGSISEGRVWHFTTKFSWATTARESFDEGAAGDRLDGLAGGTGFSGAWSSTSARVVKLAGPIGAFPANVPFSESGGAVGSTQTFPGNAKATRPFDTGALRLDLAATETSYVSFALRRDGSRTDAKLLIGLREAGTGDGIKLGVDAGVWRILGEAGEATGASVPQSETFFVVARIEALTSGDDVVSMKVYRSASELVHTDPGQLSGQGAGADQWTLVSAGGDSALLLDQLSLHIDGVQASWSVDEIRVGDSWTAVTGL